MLLRIRPAAARMWPAMVQTWTAFRAAAPPARAAISGASCPDIQLTGRIPSPCITRPMCRQMEPASARPPTVTDRPSPASQGVAPPVQAAISAASTSVHPVSWGTGTQIALNHAPYVATNGNTSCQNNYCHGSTLAGVAGSGPSCASCHLGGATSVHPLDWSGSDPDEAWSICCCEHDQRLRDRNLSRNNVERGFRQRPLLHELPYRGHHVRTSSRLGGSHSPASRALCAGKWNQRVCETANCHGSSLTGVTGSGPSCTSCHIGSPTSVHPASWGTGTQIARESRPLRNNEWKHILSEQLLPWIDACRRCRQRPVPVQICHLGGATSVHPLDWSGAILTKHGPYASANGTSGCATEILSRNRAQRSIGQRPFLHELPYRGIWGHPST